MKIHWMIVFVGVCVCVWLPEICVSVSLSLSPCLTIFVY